MGAILPERKDGSSYTVAPRVAKGLPIKSQAARRAAQSAGAEQDQRLAQSLVLDPFGRLRGLLPGANPVHLILALSSENGLSRGVGEAHRRYAALFNTRAYLAGRNDALVDVAPALSSAAWR